MRCQADLEGSADRLCWWIRCGVCGKETFGLNPWRNGDATEMGRCGQSRFWRVARGPGSELREAPRGGVCWLVESVPLEFRGEAGSEGCILESMGDRWDLKA